MHFGAPQKVFQNAKDLRRRMTASEKILWEELKQKKVGVKFRRQHPIHVYILDFYCHELKLNIELDGKYHENEEQKQLDKERTQTLESIGINEIRFSNQEVLSNIEEALNHVTTEAGKKAVAYLDFHESGWFIPPAYDASEPFAFRAAVQSHEEGFDVKVYPNPASVMINFEFENTSLSNEDLILTIYDVQGRVIHLETVKYYESFITLDSSKWGSGVYTYTITSENELLKSNAFEIIR